MALSVTAGLMPRVSILPATPSLPGNPVGQTMLINGVKLWYAQFGPMDSTQVPVLLLHGGLGNSDYYGEIVPIIAASRRVIVMDTRGHGRSQLGKVALSFDLYASDVTGLLKQLKVPKAAIIAWSHMAVGTIAAMMKPDTASFVERALLYGGYHNVDANDPAYAETAIFKEFVARAKQEYTHYQPAGDLTAFLTAVSTLDSTLPKYSIADMAKISLGEKVTIVFGDQEEAILHSEFKTLPSLITNSKLVVLKGVSHFGILQNPQLVGTTISQFLK